jgi:hypothetical protein
MNAMRSTLTYLQDFDEYEEHIKETTEEEEEGEETERPMVEEPKENPSHTQQQNAVISAPLVPSQLPGESPHNKSVQLSFFHNLHKPSLRVSKTFKEWKNIASLEWKTQSLEDAIFNWLVMVFGLSTTPLDYQD